MKNQRRVVEDFCVARSVANVEYVEEVGGGLNLKRPKFVAIMDRIEARQVSHHSLAGGVLNCGLNEIRRQFQYKAAMRDGRVVIAGRFYPSTQIGSCCGCLTGPKGREELRVEHCSECGAEHRHDGNAAINLRKLGTAGAELTRGDIGAFIGKRKHTGKCRG